MALGWRDDVHELVQDADVLVHNAGGAPSRSRSSRALPALTYRAIPGHGRADAAVLDRAGLAPGSASPASLARALESRRGAGRGDRTWPDAAHAVRDHARPLVQSRS